MSKSLHDQVKELESQLGATETEENEDGERSRNDKPSKSARSGQRSEPEERDALEEGEHGHSRKRGGNGRGNRNRQDDGADGADDNRASDEAPQSGDEAPPKDGGRTSRHGRSPRNDARNANLKDGAEEGEDQEEQEHESPVAAARLRRKVREAEAENLRLKQELASRQSDVEQQPVVETKKEVDRAPSDPEPADKNSQQWDKWKIREQDRRIEAMEGRTQEDTKQKELNTRISNAKDEFRAVQSDYIKKNPDYEQAFSVGYGNYTKALRMAHPEWTNQEIVNTADYRLLLYAGQMAKKGVNPAEAIYDYCIETLGYVPGSGKAAPARVQVPVEDEDEGEEEAPRGTSNTRKPNLRVIANNKRRSATGLNGPGQGNSARITQQDIANMTLGELANLDTDVWSELEKVR